MKSKINFILFVICVGCLITASASASTAIIEGTENGFNISASIEGNEMCSIAVYDAEEYAKSPFPTIVYCNQTTAEANGNVSLFANMGDNPYGDYYVEFGTAERTIYRGVVEYTGEAEAAQPMEKDINLNFDLSNDETYRYPFGGGYTGGVHLMSFRLTMTDINSTFRLLFMGREDTTYHTGYESFMEAMRFEKSGVVGTGIELNNYIISNKKNFEAGQEYDIDVWLDMDRRIVNYYWNNEHWATVNFPKTFNKYYGFLIRATNTGSVNAASIKDLRCISYNYDINKIPSDTPMPEYLKMPVDVYYKTSEIGNIFNDPKKVKFTEEMRNRESVPREYTKKVDICDEGGTVIFSKTEEVEFKAREEKKSELCVDLTLAEKQYGIFTVKTTLTDKASGESTALGEKEFSVIKSPAELNKKLGVNVHFGHYMGDPYTNMTLAKNAGFSSARDFIDYNSYSGEIGYSRYNNWKPYAQEYGIERLIILMGYDTATYGGVFPTTDESRKNYTDYAVAVAAELKGDAAVFELWNEMDWQVSASDYAKMLIDTVPAIKNVNKDVKIAVMCVARPRATERKWIADVIDYIQAQGLNPADYMDIVSIHPYTRNNAPEAASCECGHENDTAGNLKARVKAIRDNLNKEGLSSVKLIATEMGFYSTPGGEDTNSWNGGAHKDGLTEREQANYTIRDLALLHKELDHMQLYVINKTETGKLTEDGTGLTKTWMGVENVYGAKPVYAAVSAFNSLVGNAEIKSENNDGDKYDYVFKRADGSDIHIMWTSGTDTAVTYSTSAAGVYLYDIYGNKSYAEVTDGEVMLALSGSPIYVEDAFVSIIDEDGSIADGNSTKAKAKVEISEELIKKNGLRLICAAYSGKLLVGVTITEISEVGTVETDFVNMTKADSVKAFLWQNTSPIGMEAIKTK